MQVTNDMSLLSLISHASVPVQLIMLMLLGIFRNHRATHHPSDHGRSSLAPRLIGHR